MDMDSILHILSKVDQAIPKQDHARIHLRIDCQLFRWPEIKYFLQRMQTLKLKPTGIHLVNWEDSTYKDVILLETYENSNVMTGVSIGNCVDQLNTNFSNFMKVRWAHTLDYLVCDLKYPFSNEFYRVELAKYLDTQLYIKRYFLQQFPEKKCEIYFRQVRETQLEASASDVNSFLKYASMANQYAGLNKIKCFLFLAFDDVRRNQIGWWRIANVTNLSNISVFFEREAEYLKRETWKPTPNSDDEMPGRIESGSILIISLGVIAALLAAIGIAVLVIVYCRQRPAVPTLTSAEIDGFRFGTFVDSAGEEQAFDTRAFPKDFEIERSRFVLLNLIGKGNFGLVYNATLSIADDESIQVAVKMPLPTCSIESFKSMLSELKILCYIGTHPNVISFIGAYINQIGRGIVYIATDLCENGALQEYLRKLQEQDRDEQTGDGRLSRKLMSELVRFAHEISLGMGYIASRKVVHGDLSTRNILLDSDLQCKIGDFGLSRKLYNYEPYMKSEKGGLPIRWLAIESLRRREFTTKSDVWSYGVTLWEIFSLGSVPYPGIWMTREFVDDLENGLRMSAPAYSTTEIFHEMTACWHDNPELRPTFEQLTESFAKIRNTEYAVI